MAVPIIKEPPITWREAVIPYLLAGVNMLAPVLAAKKLLDWRVFFLSIVIICIGLPWSIYFRQRRYNYIILNLITIPPLLLLTWALTHGHRGLQIDWADPIETLSTRDSWDFLEGLLHVFILLAAGRAFLLVTSKELLQTPIPGIGIFLLSVVIGEHYYGPMPIMLLSLVPLVISSIYLFGHHHNQHWFTIYTPVRIQRRLVVWTLLCALALFPLAALLGHVMYPINMRNMSRYARRQGQFPEWNIPNPFQRRISLSFGAPLEMGGIDWPGGKLHVMDVMVSNNGRSPQPLLWRAGTYATYEKKQWTQDTPLNRSALDKYYVRADVNLELVPDSGVVDPGILAALAEHPRLGEAQDNIITQEFHVKAQLPRQAPIYGAYQAVRVASKDPRLQTASALEDGTLVYEHRRPDVEVLPYRVTSFVKPLPSVLRLQSNPQLPPDDYARYLQMPKDAAFQSKVRQLAARILEERGTASIKTDYDRVRALELYLSKHYRYTLKPSRPRKNADPILDFLFTQKQGYCVYFSGAMVMLCRSLNIPARVAVGFATGEEDDEDNAPEIATYRVTAEDAHAWTEVYLPNYGWYTVDPTAGSARVPSVWGSTWDIVSEMYGIIKTTVVAWVKLLRTSARARWIGLLSLAGLLALVGVVLYLKRDRPPTLPRRELSPAESRKIILDAFARAHRWLRRWDMPKPEDMTVREFDRLLLERNRPFGEVVSKISDLYIGVQYSADPVSDADARQAIALLHQLWTVARTEHKQLHPQDVEA